MIIDTSTDEPTIYLEEGESVLVKSKNKEEVIGCSVERNFTDDGYKINLVENNGDLLDVNFIADDDYLLDEDEE